MRYRPSPEILGAFDAEFLGRNKLGVIFRFPFRPASLFDTISGYTVVFFSWIQYQIGCHRPIL